MVSTSSTLHKHGYDLLHPVTQKGVEQINASSKTAVANLKDDITGLQAKLSCRATGNDRSHLRTGTGLAIGQLNPQRVRTSSNALSLLMTCGESLTVRDSPLR